MGRCRIICVAGGTASGKTTLARELYRLGGDERVQVLPLDSYYHDRGNLPPEERETVNYDHPDALEIKLLRFHLDALRNGNSVDAPVYDFATHSRSKEAQKIAPKDVVIIEGILALHFPELREAYSYSVFVDTDDTLRFRRRMKRDVSERGRTEESVHTQWNATVQPMHIKYCAPTRELASEVMTGESWSDNELTGLWNRILAAV
jgi:uridine kinase